MTVQRLVGEQVEQQPSGFLGFLGGGVKSRNVSLDKFTTGILVQRFINFTSTESTLSIL